MELAAVPPVLVSVQLIVAAVGAVGVVLLHAVRDRATSVGVFTTRLTGAVPAVPTFGMAVRLPL